MKSLHILDRELRQRARQRLTYGVRLGAAGIAMLIVLAWFQNQESGNPAQTGQIVFGVLSWLLFGFCLLEGTRQTADAISAERREGTLGLLFLTELSGADVIVGKLVAAITHSFYGLLATFPVLGITLAAGGVTAGEFGRTQLALLSTLFLASTAGLWISARSRDEVRPVLASLALTLGIALGPVLIDVASPPGLTLPSFSPAMGLWFATDAAYRISADRFWWTQAALIALAGLFLFGAARRTSGTWSDVEVASTPARGDRAERRWNYRVTPRLHAAPKPRRADSRPVAASVRRHRGLTLLVRVAVLLPFASLLSVQWLVFRFLGSSPAVGGMLSTCSLAIEVLNVALLALAAALPLAHAKRTGALELLLCTPIGTETIVLDHWDVYWRRLRLPLAIYALLPSVLHIVVWMAQAPSGNAYPWSYLFLGQGQHVILGLVRMIVIGWLALWCAVSAGNLGTAMGRTLILSLLIPWVATTASGVFLRQWLGQNLSGAPSSLTWFLWLHGPALNLLWLLGVAAWARYNLRHHFRRAAAGEPASRRALGDWGWRRPRTSP